MTEIQPSVVALVPDLIFASRIRAAATDVGVRCRVVSTLAALRQTTSEEPASLLILDLDAEASDAGSAISAARSARPAVRAIGFVSHVRADLAAAARAAGVNEVMARSAFVQRLPELLKRAD